MPRVAISYRRADSDSITGRIFDRLVHRYGKESVFRDIDNIPLGTDFRKYIAEALGKSDILLVIVGTRWIGGQARISDETDPVRIEVETAFAQKLHIIPVLVNRARMPKSSQLPESLKDFPFLNAAKIDSGQDFDHHLERLIRSMDRMLEEKSRGQAARAAPGTVSPPRPIETPIQPEIADSTAQLSAEPTPLHGRAGELQSVRNQPDEDPVARTVTLPKRTQRTRYPRALAWKLAGALFVLALISVVALYSKTQTSEPAIAVSVRTPGPNVKNIIDVYNQGQDFYKKTEYDSAIASYTEAIQIDPKYAPAYVGRGDAFKAKKEYEHAIAEYSEAIQLGSNAAAVYGARATAYYNNKDYDRAIADYASAIKLDPTFSSQSYAGALLARGNDYYDKKDYSHAIVDYTEAIRLDPKNALPFNRRGLAYFKKWNDYDQAIADYTEAIKLDPKSAVAYDNRGNAYYYKNDYDRAIADYDKAIEIDPKIAVNYYDRGWVYYKKNDYGRAIVDYNKSIEINPKFVIAYVGRGLAYQWKNDKDYDRAIADFSEAIRLDSFYTAAYTYRGLAYEAKGDKVRATADFHAALALPQKYTDAQWAHDTARIRLNSLGAPAAK